MSRYLKIVGYILLTVVLIFPFFHKLDTHPIKIWDESRYAVNAFEMQNNTNPLIVTFQGKPDYWNSKPPVGIWLIHLSCKIFGYNELGVRMPSALAGVFILLMFILYSKKLLGTHLPGIFMALTLASTQGIIRYHGTRTGDMDATLTFFISFYALSYFAFLVTNEKHKKLFVSLFGLGVLLAFLTKGVAALVPLPGLLIISFLHKNHQRVFRFSYLYITTLIVALVGIGYYFIRDIFDPNYIKAIFKQDLSMYTNEESVKNFSFWYYKKQITDKYFYPFALYLPISFFLSFFTKNMRLKKTMQYATIFFVAFVFIHSLSNTKNMWYDIPAYPFMAILFGGSLYVAYELLQPKLSTFKPIKRNIILLVFCVLVFYYPYSKLLNTFKSPKKYYHLEWEGEYMRHLKNHKPTIREYTVSNFKLWSDQVIFYKKSYEMNNDYSIKLKNNLKFNNDELVLTCHKASRDYISNHYEFEIIDEKNESCKLYRIISKKQ
ncbi:MAG: glycosyltransferase family 39 protein [Salinivirgaceae bacterium]|nr:glycosyltransferase family 39 protein [Salinivirgaceae bacterium]